ncbi:MAG: SDR family oxidoreductase [Rhodopseudomonas sp.]|nr:SDR family oxidoreductase [Rhodopseudomonas sp.]
MNLNGQKVVVLGGTSGIGLATAQAAAQEGAAVVVASSRKQNVDCALTTLPAGSAGHVADLADEQNLRDLFGQIGAFDHLVFTAGENMQLGTIAGTPLDQARRFFELRYWGAYAAVKYGSPHIHKGGSVVLTTGIASLRPRAGWTVPASICGAMDGLTRALAVELAPIRVNAVSPGVVRTSLWDGMAEADRKAMYKTTGAALPVGRVGEPQDIAESYLYLMRNEFSTGQIVVVDGGTVLV